MQPSADEGEPDRRPLAYDKGERRFKHVGIGARATIEFDRHDPRKWVGKCPSTLSEEDRVQLLNEAVASPNGDRELAPPKKLYVVHAGAIYEAQTSDRGRTYHGYPYKGKLSGAVLEELATMAKVKDCVTDFDKWVKTHIVRHGERR